MEETSTQVKPMVLDYDEICRMAPFFKGRRKLVDRLFHILSIDKVNDIHARNCDTPGVEVFIKDYQNLAFMKSAGTFRIANDEEYKYIGLISYGGNINSLTLKGFKYEIENRTLTDDTTLGVSNELVSDYGEITVKAGRLLIVMTRDK